MGIFLKKIIKWVFSFLVGILIVLSIISTTLMLCTNEKGVISFNKYALLLVGSNASSYVSDIDDGDAVVLEKTDFGNLQVNDVIGYIKNKDNNYSVEIGKIVSIGSNSSNQKTIVISGSDNTSFEIYENSYIGKWNYKKILFFGTVFGFLLDNNMFLLFIILPLFLLFVYEIVKIVLSIRKDEKNDNLDNIDNDKSDKDDVELISYDNTLLDNETVESSSKKEEESDDDIEIL